MTISEAIARVKEVDLKEFGKLLDRDAKTVNK